MRDYGAIDSPGRWVWLLASFAAVFALFHFVADALGSGRGEFGLLIGALVVAATVGVERALFVSSWPAAAVGVGLGPPKGAGLAAAVDIASVLALTVPAFLWLMSSSGSAWPGWLGLLPGLFAQAGLAEEVLFRGYLYGHLRRGRSFWRAAFLASLPFMAVHLLLFTTLPAPVAATSLGLAFVLSFPLARLYELGGATIWAPAIVHCIIQAGAKLVVVIGEGAQLFPFAWLGASAVVPWLAFAFKSSAPKRA